jgi:hypothetical protein
LNRLEENSYEKGYAFRVHTGAIFARIQIPVHVQRRIHV